MCQRRAAAAFVCALVCVLALALPASSHRLLNAGSSRRQLQQAEVTPISSNVTCQPARLVNLTSVSTPDSTYSTLVPITNFTFPNGTATNYSGFSVTISVGDESADMMLPVDPMDDLEDVWVWQVTGPTNDTVCYNDTDADGAPIVTCYPARYVYVGINDTDFYVAFKQAVDNTTTTLDASLTVGDLIATLSLVVGGNATYDTDLEISITRPTNATICPSPDDGTQTLPDGPVCCSDDAGTPFLTCTWDQCYEQGYPTDPEALLCDSLPALTCPPPSTGRK